MRFLALFQSVMSLYLANAQPGMLQNQISVDLNERFDDVAPFCFFYEPDSLKSKRMSKALKSFYFPHSKIDVTSFESLTQVSLLIRICFCC